MTKNLNYPSMLMIQLPLFQTRNLQQIYSNVCQTFKNDLA